jgi:tRNA threonylcarbamoyladenosine biosynthesis protein TsaE
MSVITRSPSQTRWLGERLGRLVEKGDVILLQGDLGAGKTALTQGLAKALGVTGYVSSPTFTLVNEYDGRLPVYHIDLYRIEQTSEAVDLGLEEYLYGRGVSIIEWPERAPEVWPEEHLLVRISDRGGNSRKFVFKPVGERYVALLKALRASRPRRGV